MAKVYWSFDSTKPVYPIKFLLLQMIVIEVSLYCWYKYTTFGTNTHNPQLYILSFGCFLFSLAFKKSGQMTINITQDCVFVPKFAYLSQQYNETLITMICNSKNLIG